MAVAQQSAQVAGEELALGQPGGQPDLVFVGMVAAPCCAQADFAVAVVLPVGLAVAQHYTQAPYLVVSVGHSVAAPCSAQHFLSDGQPVGQSDLVLVGVVGLVGQSDLVVAVPAVAQQPAQAADLVLFVGLFDGPSAGEACTWPTWWPCCPCGGCWHGCCPMF